MALPPLATAAELAIEPGVTLDLEDDAAVASAEAVLRKASTLVRSHAGLTWVDEDTDDLEDDIPDAVGEVVLLVAARVLRNPTGQVTEQAGPFARGFGATAADGLYLTKGEKAMLNGGQSARPGLGTISLSRDEVEELVYLLPTDGSEPILHEGGWTVP